MLEKICSRLTFNNVTANLPGLTVIKHFSFDVYIIEPLFVVI